MLGLNTEENILVNPGDKPLVYVPFLKPLDHVSIRTFRGNDLDTPHFPHITKMAAHMKIPDLLHNNYNVIVATPINPEDCELAGAAIKTIDGYVFNVAEGPGTVRRVTRDGIIDTTYDLKGRLATTDDYRINYAANEFNKTGLYNTVFEFSWYNKPVGIKNEKFICWEVTDDGTGESGI